VKTCLVVGAGFAGAVVARELADSGNRVLLIDQRDHIGGNAFDYVNEHGIRVHKYGPHIFHTSNEHVVRWLSRFTEWVEYKHKVKAMLPSGRLVTLPVNRETRSIVGDDAIIDTFFRPYSEKMWGMPLERIDPDVMNRVKSRDDDNEYYFPEDQYQLMPLEGYTRIFERILDHPNIEVQLQRSYERGMESGFDHCFNSMAIDEFFEYKYGRLPYRSIRFETVTLPVPKVFPVAVVNFTHRLPYTRITEWKHFDPRTISDYTTLTYEQPCSYEDNNFERYYPIKDVTGENRAIYRRYFSDVPRGMTFIGRCGQYVYLDMHQAISSSLSIARRYIAERSFAIA
jgi:UDP-galactopyranose mutase